jgi:hypothetical protein
VKNSRQSLRASLAFPAWSALLSGADGEQGAGDAGGSGNSGGAAGAGEGGSTGGEGGQNTGGSAGGQSGDPDKKIRYLEEEKDRHFTSRKQAERERDDALRKLKELEDKDKDEKTKAQERVQELESSVTSLREQNQRLAVENAFLKENTYAWQSPEVALRLADLSSVEIDKEGRVVGLKAALDKLAKDNPFLLKPKDEGDKGGSGNPPPSGDAPGSRRGTGGDANADKERLRQKYPALRR